MIDITGWVSAYVDKLRPLLMQYRMYLLVLLAIPIVTTTYEDYCEWYKLGAGGIPHNFLGYVIQLMLSFLTGRDRRSIAWLDSPKNTELDKTSFLNTTLPTREGDRPTIGPYCVPHRQTTDAASEELKKTLQTTLSKISSDNSASLEYGSSKIEGGNSHALFVTEQMFATNHISYPRSPREIFHLHDSEGSGHGVFSKADAVLIIQKAWGEKHPLSGMALGIPESYLIIYAPRNEEEIKVVEMLARAAARHGLEGEHLL